MHHAWAQFYSGHHEKALVEAEALFDSSERAEAWLLGGSLLTQQADPDRIEEGRRLLWGALGLFSSVADARRAARTRRHALPAPRRRRPARVHAWNVTALSIDPPESSALKDPKDPWPPPPPPLRVALAQVSAEWFTAELAAARTRIAGQLAGKSIPASVLDALLTGR